MARAANGRSDLKPFSVFDFRKGVDLRTSPLTLALSRGQNALRKADGCVYTSSGAVTKRFDITTLTTSSVGASVAITGGWEFRLTDDTRHVLFGTSDGRVMKLNDDGTTTGLASGLTSNVKWSFATFNDLALICNRADAPRSYDGTTFGALAGTPPTDGGPVVVHNSRAWMLDGTNKATVYGSALGDAQTWTGGTSLNFTVQDGSPVVALVPGVGELVILTKNRPHRLQGNAEFATTRLDDVASATGVGIAAVSAQAALFADNDVWYLTRGGLVRIKTVIEFGDLRAKFATDRIGPYFEQNSGYTLSLQNLDDAVMAYDPHAGVIYVGADSNADGENDMLLVYNVLLGSWSIWPSVAAASMWQVQNNSTGVVEIYVGGYDGHIRVLNRDVSTNAIDGHVRHLSCLGAPGIEKSPRYGFLYLKEEGNYSVSVDTKFDFGASGGQTYAASLLGGSKTLGVNWTLGTDPLGAKEQIVKRIDMAGVGEFVEIGVRNQNAGQPFTLYGYEILWRARRAVRRGTAS